MDLQTAQKIVNVERRLDTLKAPERSSDLISPFLALTGLRGFWPMSAFSSAGAAYDQSGNGRTLTYNGNPVFGYDGLAPYCAYDGTGDYHTRADEAGLDITGTETYVDAAYRGLTMGGWFNPAAFTAAAVQGLMGKFSAGVNQRSYILRTDPAGGVRFTINNTGAAAGNQTVTSPTAMSINSWYFIVGRFDPGTEIAVFVNGIKETAVAGIHANLFSGASDFDIGGGGGGVDLSTIKASLCFLCAAALSDAHISSLFQQTRGAFGV
jgi:hypothetical protein